MPDITPTPTSPAASASASPGRVTGATPQGASPGVLDRIGALLDTSGAVLPAEDVYEDTDTPVAEYGSEEESDSNESATPFLNKTK
jgi:hypothetical protein